MENNGKFFYEPANRISISKHSFTTLTEEACMLAKLKRLFRDEEGQDMIEYALLAAFISIVAIVAIKAIGPLVLAIYNDVVTALTP